MKISIFGLGYVGCVSAGCLVAAGHQVIGVDVNQVKVDLINAAKSPIIENGLQDLIAEGVSSDRLHATTDAIAALGNTDLSLVCVGTPSDADGSLDLRYVRRVAEDIGHGLRQKKSPHVVVVRSTLLPGTTEGVLLPILERASGLQAGTNFGLAYNPEFLREGNAVADYYEPPRTVLGEFDQHSGDLVAPLYADLAAPLIRTDIRTAEMVKYADNAFHALKIAFANEIGATCRAGGIDSHQLMDIFVLDTKLNLSPAYLRPGYAFGGSCLPKDLRALTHWACSHDIATPVLASVLPSNECHKERALAMIEVTGKRQLAVLGLSFKPNTDDLRESPAVELVEALLQRGYQLQIYDRSVSLARLVGANREYIERGIPHISSLMVSDLEAAVSGAETVVVTSSDAEFRRVPAMLRPDQILIDLARIVDNPRELGDQYHGIAW